jgi:transcriptional regulator with XRE-family HTH domain
MTTNQNERLYALLVATDQTPAKFAGRVGVDPKTVERWITTGRNPHPRIARRAANLLDVEDTYLWPSLYARRHPAVDSTDELVACYPGRAAVPADLWPRLLDGAASGSTSWPTAAWPTTSGTSPPCCAAKQPWASVSG